MTTSKPYRKTMTVFRTALLGVLLLGFVATKVQGCKCNGNEICNASTGTCSCPPGLTGRHCLDDINECNVTGSLTPCKNRDTYCFNTHGSYECRCRVGFSMSSNGRCYPCGGQGVGEACQKKCDCEEENTAACSSDIGVCVCKVGYVGTRCQDDKDDCYEGACREKVCVDVFRGFECQCGAGERYIQGRCKKFHVEMHVEDTSPMAGEFINIYLIYSLSMAYRNAPLLSPDFLYTLHVNDIEICKMSFHASYIWNRGSLPVTPNDQYKKYQFYSHFRVRLGEPGHVNLIATPASGEYTTLRKVVDVRQAHSRLTACNPLIENVAMCTESYSQCIHKKSPEKKRQSYHKFRYVNQNRASCSNLKDYGLQWHYWKMGYDKLTMDGHCFNSKNMYPLDIQELLASSGEYTITDNYGSVEVIPKNTLPLGRILVCVRASLKDNTFESHLVCGTIEVTVSYYVYGSLEPVGDILNFKDDSGPQYILANFREPDAGLNLKHKLSYTQPNVYKSWKSCWSKVLAHGVPYEIDPIALCNPSMRSKNMYKHIRKAHVVLSTYIEGRNDVRNKRVFDIEYSKRDVFIHTKAECYRGCTQVVGTHEEVAIYFRAIRPLFRKPRSFITYIGKKCDLKIMGMAANCDRSTAPNFDRSLLVFKAGTLQPNKKYTIDFSSQVAYIDDVKIKEKYSVPRYRYSFRTAPKPRRKRSCTIAPNRGNLTITRFTVTCNGHADAFRDGALRFHVHQEYKIQDIKEPFYTLIAYSGDHTITNITLSNPDFKTEGIRLRIKIWTANGSAIEEYQHMLLESILDRKPLIEKFMTEIKSERLHVPRQESIHFLRDVANMVSSYGVNASDPGKDKNLENIKDVRNTILGILTKHKRTSPEWIEQTTMVLERATFNLDDIDIGFVGAGLQVAHRLSIHFDSKKWTDWETFDTVARMLILVVDRLLTKVVEHRSVLVDIDLENEERMKKKAMTLQAVETIERMSDLLADQHAMGRENFTLKVEAKTLLVGTKRIPLQWRTPINYDDRRYSQVTKLLKKHLSKFAWLDQVYVENNGTACFSLSVNHTGVTGGDSIEIRYQVYEKNPYTFTKDKINGDLPLINVKFIRHKRCQTLAQCQKQHMFTESPSPFQFSGPADILLKRPSNETHGEPIDHAVTVELEERGSDLYVTRSSCVYFSVRASRTWATVLDIQSEHGLVLKTILTRKFRRIVSPEDSDARSTDIPMKKPQTLWTPAGMLTREPNLLFIPQISRHELSKSSHVRVRLSVKLEQKFETIQDLFQTEVNSSSRSSDTITRLSIIRVTSYKLSCKHFEERTSTFRSDKCWVTMFSNLSNLHCRCSTAAPYTGSYEPIKASSKVDEGVLAQIFNNPVPMSLVVATWMIYMASISWARRRDKQDVKESKVSVLDTLSDAHSYVYLICMTTGWSVRAATTSKVFIFLSGSWANSEVHLLRDDNKRLFQSGANDWFLLTTTDDLGEIQSVVVWTDFSGEDPSWFLDNVYIENLQTNEFWSFHYNSWLSIVFGDKQLVAEIPVSKQVDASAKWRTKLINDIRNDHLWVGVFAKSQSNTYTRVERLTTVLTMLQALIFLNLIWSGERDEEGWSVNVLGQTINIASVIISFETSFLVTVLGVAIAFIFSRIDVQPLGDKERQMRNALTEEQKAVLHRMEDMKKKRGLNVWNFMSAGGMGGGFHSLAPQDPTSGFDKAAQRSSSPMKNTTFSSGSGTNGEVFDIFNPFATYQASSSTSEYKSAFDSGETSEEQSTSVTSSSTDGTEVDFFLDSIEESEQTGVSRKTKDTHHTHHTHHAHKQKRLSHHHRRRQSVHPGSNSWCMLTTPHRFLLPWWTEYPVWLCVLALNIVLTYHIPWVGLNMDYEKSLELVLTFLTGLIIDVVLLIPAKVVAVAAVRVYLLRHEMAHREQTAPVKELDESMRLIARSKVTKRPVDPKARKQTRTATYRPISQADANEVMERLKIESEAREMMRDLVLYSLFTVTVLLIISARIDVTAQYRQKVNVEAVMLGIMPEDVVDGDPFSEIHDITDTWNYLIDTAIPHLIPTSDEAEQDLTRAYHLINNVRLRQVRASSKDDENVNDPKDKCEQVIPEILWPRDSVHGCREDPSLEQEEKRDFNSSWNTWKRNLKVKERNEPPYKYWTSEDLKTSPFVGRHGVYSGGGYVVDFLRKDAASMQGDLRELRTNGWIDKLSRCIFLEFTVYNPASDMFTQVILSFEMNQFGGVFGSETIRTANLSIKGTSSWTRLFEVISAACVVFYTLTSIKQLIKLGPMTFFESLWNWLEVLVVFVSILCVSFYITRHTIFLQVMDDIQNQGWGVFVDFTRIFFWQSVFHYTMAFFGALVIIKMLKVTTFNPFSKVFTHSIAIGYADFRAFMICTAVVILAFAGFGYLAFGTHTSVYATYSRTLMTLLFFILGEPDFPVLVSVNLFIGRVFFITFMFCSQYAVLNLFISILRDSLEQSRVRSFRRENAVVKYMVDTALLYFNLTGIFKRGHGKEAVNLT